MANTIDNDDFMCYCRVMFEDNRKERWEFGQKPYNSFGHYYKTNSTWLSKKFNKRKQ